MRKNSGKFKKKEGCQKESPKPRSDRTEATQFAKKQTTSLPFSEFGATDKYTTHNISCNFVLSRLMYFE